MGLVRVGQQEEREDAEEVLEDCRGRPSRVRDLPDGVRRRLIVEEIGGGEGGADGTECAEGMGGATAWPIIRSRQRRPYDLFLRPQRWGVASESIERVSMYLWQVLYELVSEYVETK